MRIKRSSEKVRKRLRYGPISRTQILLLLHENENSCDDINVYLFMLVVVAPKSGAPEACRVMCNLWILATI